MITFKQFIKSTRVRPVSMRLTEGGAAGHMSHIFDNRDLTFKDLKKILKEVFEGDVSITQKLDGQNLSVTWKDGQIGLARNKATLKEPLTIDQTAKKFEGRGELKNAFVNSLRDLENAFKTVDEAKLNEWFENGKNFLSVEIIYPATTNVIPYDNCVLVLHGMLSYDDKLNPTGELDDEIVKEIYDELNKNDALQQKTFTIEGPQAIQINQALDIKDLEAEAEKKIDDFVGDNGLKETDTIQDYIDTKVSPTEKMRKSDRAEREKEALAPLEQIILEISAKFLKMLVPFIVNNPDKKIKALKHELETNIKDLETVNLSDSDRKRIEKNIEKLEKIGLDNIVPIEGIVFKYKDKAYKLTGAFAPLNQILGILKYKK